MQMEIILQESQKLYREAQDHFVEASSKHQNNFEYWRGNVDRNYEIII